MYQKKHPITYNLFGIYVDWQIDNNWISNSCPDVNGINSFESFIEQNGWKVVEIEFKGKKMITLDIEFPRLKFLNMLGIQPKRVIEEKMCAAYAERELQRFLKKSGLPYFDVFEYYMNNTPWNLKSKTAYNNNHTITITF